MKLKTIKKPNLINSLQSVRFYMFASVIAVIMLSFWCFSQVALKNKRNIIKNGYVIAIKDGRIKTWIIQFKTFEDKTYNIKSLFRLDNCVVGDSIKIAYEANNPKNAEISFDTVYRTIFNIIQPISLCITLFLWSIYTYSKIKSIIIQPILLYMGYFIISVALLEFFLYIIFSLLSVILPMSYMMKASYLWELFYSPCC